MFFFNPMFLVFIGPGLLLALYATMKTKSTFGKYSQVGSSRGYTGAEAAHEMLRRSEISNVSIERVGGMLTDHYDPMHKTLRLSEQVYGSRSLSAIGIACHEAGHAIQHAHGYAALSLRTALVPVTNLCSTLYVWVIIIGAFMHRPHLAMIGVVMLAVAVLFAIVTLPVEWDASRRAKIAMANAGLLSSQEAGHAAKVLNAAFLTYLASAITSILTLVYWLMQLGFFGGSDD